MVARYPEFNAELTFPEEEQSFEMVMSAIKAVRARRSEMNVPPSRKAHLIIATDRKAAFEAGGLPTLVLDSDGCDRSNGGGGQIVTRIEAFLEQIGAGL